MSNEALIKAWKNPEQRGNANHPSGRSFNELSIDEMIAVNGAAETQATPSIISALTLPTATQCISAAASLVGSASVSGIVSYVTFRKCFG
ncbi:mersacidin family lantibiotic [Cytobacillus gottheilii]|uniref:mersacidin family lantibiotic n=1 Tax=Cytobacillus gottheilii TaxID=859144 RepID=UPI0009BB3FF8|nr:mersacidin family lantibiotic [Cytobacillus gottheilii]